MMLAGPTKPINPDCAISVLCHTELSSDSVARHTSVLTLETEILPPAKVLPAQCLCSHSSPGRKLNRSSGYIWGGQLPLQLPPGAAPEL